MLKVVIVIPSLKQSGVLEVVKNILIKGKRDSQIDFFLIALKDIENFDNKRKMQKILGDHLLVLPGSKLVTIKNIHAFRKSIKNINPDIIHFNAFESDLFSYFVNNRNYKLISTAHNMGKHDFIPTYGKFVGYSMGMVQKYLYKRMSLVIGVSRTVTNYYKKMKIPNVSLVYNGTSVSADKISEKSIGNYPHPIGIYSGNFERRKNVEFLFTSYNKLPRNSTLVVIGDDPRNKNTLEEYRKKYKNIKFFGRVKNVSTYLKQADYIVSASLSEGLPMAVIEGMACNLPMILSNIPQHKELFLSKKEDIYFFDPTDENSLLSTLKKYIKGWPQNDNYCNSSIFKKFFSSDHMYLNYKNQYEKLLKEK